MHALASGFSSSIIAVNMDHILALLETKYPSRRNSSSLLNGLPRTCYKVPNKTSLDTHTLPHANNNGNNEEDFVDSDFVPNFSTDPMLHRAELANTMEVMIRKYLSIVIRDGDITDRHLPS